jgi:glycosyltransferase involved in cell wall biosynthesis
VTTLTIAIPTFNPKPEHLREALESIVRETQNASNIEVVIADNGSDSSAAGFLGEYASLYPQFRFVRHEHNLGFDRNVLRLLDNVDSEFVWFLGDDDLILPGSVASILGVIEENPNAEVLLSPAFFFRETSEIDLEHVDSRSGVVEKVGKDFVRLSEYTAAALSTFCISTTAMRSADVEFAVGSNWIHFAVMLVCFAGRSQVRGVMMERNLVAVRLSNAGRWFSHFGNQYRSGLVLLTVAEQASSGDEDSLYEFFRAKRFQKNFIDILTLAWPLTRVDRRELYWLSHHHFRGYVRFRLIDAPLLMAPNWVKGHASRGIRIAGQVRRRVRHASLGQTADHNPD